jgi:hypothetical protein
MFPPSPKAPEDRAIRCIFSIYRLIVFHRIHSKEKDAASIPNTFLDGKIKMINHLLIVNKKDAKKFPIVLGK